VAQPASTAAERTRINFIAPSEKPHDLRGRSVILVTQVT